MRSILFVISLVLIGTLAIERRPYWPVSHQNLQNTGLSPYDGIMTDYAETDYVVPPDHPTSEHFTGSGVLGYGTYGDASSPLYHYVPTNAGNTGGVYVVDVTDGSVKHMFTTAKPVSQSPVVIQAPVTKEEVVIFFDDDGTAYCKKTKDCIDRGTDDCDYRNLPALNGRPAADPQGYADDEEMHIFIPFITLPGGNASLAVYDGDSVNKTVLLKLDDGSYSSVALSSDRKYLWWAIDDMLFCVLNADSGAARVLDYYELPDHNESFMSAPVLGIDEDDVFITTSAGRLFYFQAVMEGTEVHIKRQYVCMYYREGATPMCCSSPSCPSMSHKASAAPPPSMTPDNRSLILSVGYTEIDATTSLGGIYKIDIETGSIIWRYDADAIDCDVQPTVDDSGNVFAQVFVGSLAAIVGLDVDPNPQTEDQAQERFFIYSTQNSDQTSGILIVPSMTGSQYAPHLITAFPNEIQSLHAAFMCPSTSEFDMCSGHGGCNTQVGQCTCASPYTGDDCSETTEPIFPLANHDTHNTGLVDHVGPRYSAVAQDWKYQISGNDKFNHAGVLGFGLGSTPENPQRLYVGSDKGILHAIHVDTGKLLWKVQFNKDVLATPAVMIDVNDQAAGEILFVGAMDGTLSAYRADKCTMTDVVTCRMWTKKYSEPITGDIMVTSGSHDDQLHNYLGSVLVFLRTKPDNVTAILTVVDPMTGGAKWEHELKSTTMGMRPDYFQFIPAIDDRKLYIAHDCDLYAFDLFDGKSVAQANCPGQGQTVDRFASSVVVDMEGTKLFVQLESGRLARYDLDTAGKTVVDIHFRYVCKAGMPNSDCCTTDVASCGLGQGQSFSPPLPLPSPALDPWNLYVYFVQYRLEPSTGPNCGVFLMDMEDGQTIWQINDDYWDNKIWSKTSPTVDITGMAYVVGSSSKHSIFMGIDPYPLPSSDRGLIRFEYVLPDKITVSEMGQERVLLRNTDENDRRMIVSTETAIFSFMESIACPTNETYTVCSGHGECTLEGICICDGTHIGLACEGIVTHPIQTCPKDKEGRTCADHGTCDQTTHKCTCRSGWKGIGCDIEKKCPSFKGVECGGHGTCMSATDTCACNANYIGHSCELTCPSDDPSLVCSGHGQCNTTTYMVNCMCEHGWEGVGCEQASNGLGSGNTLFGVDGITDFGTAMIILFGAFIVMIGILIYLWYTGQFGGCCGACQCQRNSGTSL